MQRALLALVLLAVPLTGCFGSGAPAGEVVGPDAAPEETTPPETLPDGRKFKATEETERTEPGLGGRAHMHDYWLDDTVVTVFDRKIWPTGSPFPSRDDTQRLFSVYVQLDKVPGEDDRHALVYEGTGLVEFTIVSAPPWVDTTTLSFRTAASDWSDEVPLGIGETFAYEPAKKETDMPHSTRSLWNWKVVASAPVPVTGTWPIPLEPGAFEIRIVVHKARDVDDWPGHPAFYDGVDKRIVLDANGRTDVQHAADVVLFGIEPDQLVPDRLISMGTRDLHVYVNITSIDSPVFPPTGYTLNWRSASVPPYSSGVHQNANETEGETWAYWHIRVDDDMLDAPYQPQSRWTFKVLMNTGTAVEGRAAHCYRCLPYSIEYHLKVVATPDPELAAAALEDE